MQLGADVPSAERDPGAVEGTQAASPLPGHRHHRTAVPMPPALRLPLPPHASSLSPNVWDSRPALRLRLTSARRPSGPRTCCCAVCAGVQSPVVLRCPAPCQRRQLLPAAQALHIPPRERGPVTVALLRPVLINGLANLVREAANLPMLYLDTWAAGLG